jgi:hypothetical protein
VATHPARLVLLTVAAAMIAGCGEPEGKRARRYVWSPALIAKYGVGDRVEDRILVDAGATTHSLAALRGRIAVLEFLQSRCPDVRRSEKARQRLLDDYSVRGVAYLAVNPGHTEHPTDEILPYLRDSGSSYPVLLDYDKMVALRFNITRVPEAVVLDREGVIRFMGCPCSPAQWGSAEPERFDWLEAVLDSLLAGRVPELARRPPIGCKVRQAVLP